MLVSKFSKALLTTTALLCVMTSPALADAKDDKIAAMEAQMKIMMEEIQTMKAERAAEKAEAKAQQTALHAKVNAIEVKTDAAVANIAPAAGINGNGANNNDVKITMKGGTPKFEKGHFSWQPTGRIHLDAGQIDDDKVDNPNSTEFRRARLGMKGSFAKDFNYKLEVDFAGNRTSINDSYLNYSGVKNTNITIGGFKPSYSLEEAISSNDLTFIERSAPVDSFTSGRKLGAGFKTYNKNWTAAAGIFGGNIGTQSSDDEEWAIAGRVTGAPINDGAKLIHLGASAAYREPDQANDRFDFDARAENRLQTSDSVSIVLNDAEDAQVYALEGAAGVGPLSIQGEYVRAEVNNRGGQDPSFDGYYGQLAYTLTGESRAYKTSKGAFGGIKPNNPFDPANGDWGAFEMAARYSTLDLNDSGLNGGELDTVTLGANWYLNNHIRFMGNVIFVDTDENAVVADDDPTIFITRSQINF